MATICTSANVKLAAGTNVSTALSNDDYTEFINQAEGQLIADTGVNWVDAYSGLDADFSQAVEQAVAAYAAINAIRYDINGYPTLNHVLSIVNMNLDRYDRAVSKLKEMDTQAKFGVSKID